jgi:hypothetical protein
MLLAIWIILLLVVLSFLSSLMTFFNNSPEGQTFVSLSWAGYIISQSFNSQREVTAISGSWIVPQINASEGNGYSSAWIGIGGQSDKTLIQVGTEHDSAGGQTIYYAWYELLPNFLVSMNGLIISPGDSITASLTLIDPNLNLWKIRLIDITSGQTFTLDVNYNSSLASGEWIVERPSINNQISTLCDFGAIPFHNCQITLTNVVGSINNFTYSKIQMANQATQTLASTSTLSATDSSFTVNYVAGS